VLGYIARGSFGPILKVKDKVKQKTYAVKVRTSVSATTKKYYCVFCVVFQSIVCVVFLKVIPKSEILRHGVLEQSKEEVIVQVRH